MPITVQYAPNAGALGAVAAYGGGAENTMRAAQMQQQQLQALLAYNAQRNASSDQLDAATMATNERGNEAAAKQQGAADDRNAYGQAMARHDEQQGQMIEAKNQSRYDMEEMRQDALTGRTGTRIDARAELQRTQLSAQEQRMATQLQSQLDLNDKLLADEVITPEEHSAQRSRIGNQLAPYRARQTRTQQLTNQAGAQDFQAQLQSTFLQYPEGHPNAGQPVLDANNNPIHAGANGKLEAVPINPVFSAADRLKVRESVINAMTTRGEALDEAVIAQRTQAAIGSLSGRANAPAAAPADEFGRVPIVPSPFSPPAPTPPGQAPRQAGMPPVQRFAPSPTGEPVGNPGTPNPRTEPAVAGALQAVAAFAQTPEGEPFRNELTALASHAQQLLNVYGKEKDMPEPQQRWMEFTRRRVAQIRARIRAGGPAAETPPSSPDNSSAGADAGGASNGIDPEHPGGLGGVVQSIRDWFSPPAYATAGQR